MIFAKPVQLGSVLVIEAPNTFVPEPKWAVPSDVFNFNLIEYINLNDTRAGIDSWFVSFRVLKVLEANRIHAIIFPCPNPTLTPDVNLWTVKVYPESAAASHVGNSRGYEIRAEVFDF